MKIFAEIVLPVVFAATIASASDKPVKTGRLLAKTWCNACHVITRGDTSFDDGEIAPAFSDMKTASAAKLLNLLRKGHGQTPALSKLTDVEASALAAYIASQSKD